MYSSLSFPLPPSQLTLQLTHLPQHRCGIFAAHAYDSKDLPAFRARAVALSKRLRHRGPDWSGCKMTDDAILVHERLAIVGVGQSIFFLLHLSLPSVARTRRTGG
jgi:hypothetical protein